METTTERRTRLTEDFKKKIIQLNKVYGVHEQKLQGSERITKLNTLMKRFNEVTKLNWTMVYKDNAIAISRMPHFADWTGTIDEAIKYVQQNISIATGKW